MDRPEFSESEGLDDYEYSYWFHAYEKVLKDMYRQVLYNLRLRGVATSEPLSLSAFCTFVYAHSSKRISALHCDDA